MTHFFPEKMKGGREKPQKGVTEKRTMKRTPGKRRRDLDGQEWSDQGPTGSYRNEDLNW